MPLTPKTPSPYTERLLPHEGAAADVNPPGFVWPKGPAGATYTLELRHADGRRVERADLRDPVCALTETLAPGAWRWRVVTRGQDGAVANESDWHRFEMPADAPVVRMPKEAEIAERLKDRRPRIFFTDGGFDRLRRRIQTDRETGQWWDEVMRRVALAEPVEPFDEPADWDPAKMSDPTAWNAEWVRIYTPGKRASAAMARFALAWRVTGEPRYLALAKAWALKVASWDPLGCTAHRGRKEGNDEAGMPILERLSWTYDWLHDQWTAAERRAVLACLTARAEDTLGVLRKQDYLASPLSSHEGRVQGFLGAAALACYGEVPEAADWLTFVLTATLTCYPFWGDADGGWAQGLSYWSAYYYWLSQWGEIAKRALGVDLHQRGWFRNTGYFALYCHPFYAPYGGFGDGAENPPSLQEKIAIDLLARVHRDPYLSWHVSKMPTFLEQRSGRAEWNEWQLADVGALLVAAFYDRVEPKEPTALGPARFFRDIGWMAAHSRLGDPGRDVWLVFKSSPYGAFSHSHADQNAFILGACGEQLLISAGHYPWYGSRHHWTDHRASRSKCLVLVNGHGQAPRYKESRGDVEYYSKSADGRFVVVRGEAAWGYNLPLPPDALEAERDVVPPEALQPSVEVLSYKRTVVFVRESEVGPVVVVLDRLATDQPAKFQWLLHALSAFDLSGEVGCIGLTRGQARLTARVVSDQPLAVTQTDQFVRPPEIRQDRSLPSPPNHWHLTAETTAPTDRGSFLAVLVPYREGEAPVIEPRSIDGALALAVGGLTVAAPVPANAESRLVLHGKTVVANLAVFDAAGKPLVTHPPLP
jgi:hypothetical protein